MSNSVNVYFFNVNNGDSIIIEFCGDIKRYVVIDSNVIRKNDRFINPAYELLKSKNVRKISALIISHFHKDHYNGIEDFLLNIDIDKIVIPPILSTNSNTYNQIIKKYADKAKDLVLHSDDLEIKQYAESLAHLLFYMTNNEEKMEEASGKESILRFPDIPDKALTYLPFKNIKGILQQKILGNNFNPNFFPQMNDASIAFKLTCFGYGILFSGDSTYNQWRDHKNIMLKDNINNLGINFLKSPHHGSKYNNNEELYSYFFKEDIDKKYLLISANGINHPDKEVFDLIEKYNILPYCTNLSRACSTKILQFEPANEIPEIMRPFLINYVEEQPRPCQGNIILNINKTGLTINSSTENPCLYRNIVN